MVTGVGTVSSGDTEGVDARESSLPHAASAIATASVTPNVKFLLPEECRSGTRSRSFMMLLLYQITSLFANLRDFA